MSCLDLIEDLHQNCKGQRLMIWWIDIPQFLHPTSRILSHHSNMGTLDVTHWIVSFNWRRIVHMIISKIMYFQNMVPQRYFFKMAFWWREWNDFVACMQLGKDLQAVWLMFNHYKHVKEWTTMACHVCDPIYFKVLTIVVCDMQVKDVKFQVLMWQALLRVMKTNGGQLEIQRVHS